MLFPLHHLKLVLSVSTEKKKLNDSIKVSGYGRGHCRKCSAFLNEKWAAQEVAGMFLWVGCHWFLWLSSQNCPKQVGFEEATRQNWTHNGSSTVQEEKTLNFSHVINDYPPGYMRNKGVHSNFHHLEICFIIKTCYKRGWKHLNVCTMNFGFY